MIIEIGKTITTDDLIACEHLKAFEVYEIYRLDGYETYFFAIDNSQQICGFIQFTEIDDEWQAAHAHTLETLKRKGIGTALMIEAVEYFHSFELPSTDTNASYYYIENGLSYVNRCFDKGILTDPPFKRPCGSERPDDY